MSEQAIAYDDYHEERFNKNNGEDEVNMIEDSLEYHFEATDSSHYRVVLDDLTPSRAELISNFIGFDLNLKTFHTMSQDNKDKLAKKMTILVCKEFSPRKNWGVSKASIEYIVRVILYNTYKKWTESEGVAPTVSIGEYIKLSDKLNIQKKSG